MSLAPLVSVVVPVFNDEPGLALCLDALARQTVGTSRIQVLVVDNASARPPLHLVSRYSFARLLSEPQPGSYNARNRGCCSAKGEFLAFTDADCQPRPDWLAVALERLRREPTLGAVGGSIELTLSARPLAAELFEKVFAFPQHKYVERYGFAATANLVVRRTVFEDVGPFNGRLRSGGDYEWGQRLNRAGYRMGYVADAVVSHPARASMRELIRKRRRVIGGLQQLPPLVTLNPRWADTVSRGRPRGFAMGATLLLAPDRLGLRHLQGLQVLMVAAVLSITGFLERMRLGLGAPPVR